MINTSAAHVALKQARLQVLGIAVVGAVTPDDVDHTYVRCADEIVRLHWNGKPPSAKRIERAAAIIGQHSDPVCDEPIIL